MLDFGIWKEEAQNEKKAYVVFCIPKTDTNFEAFCEVISSNKNHLFLKSGGTYLSVCFTPQAVTSFLQYILQYI